MCQFTQQCPVTRHRDGTRCRVVIAQQRAAAREHERQKQLAWGLTASLVIIAATVGVYLVFADRTVL